MAIPAILKGDTSGGIVLDILSGYDYTGCTLTVGFNGVRKSFTDLVAGGTKTLHYTADETAGMPLGTAQAAMTLTNAAGVVRSMPWVKIRVTDIPSEIYDRHITIDPSQLDVTDATTGDSLGAVKAKLNAVMAFLRGGAALCVALVGCACFGAVAPLYTDPNNMPGDAPIMTNVVEYVTGAVEDAGGMTPQLTTNVAAAVVSNTVPAWARQDDPPEAMADNALVLTNGAVKTKDGLDTITAAQVGAIATGRNKGKSFILGTDLKGAGAISFSYYGVDATVMNGIVSAAGMTPSSWDWLTLNDVGFGTWLEYYFVHTETDPTISAWAKAAAKPTYTAAEVGAISETMLTNTALRVANHTWDAGYQILWEKQANLGGFYEVCITNVDLTAGGAQ